MNTGRIRGENSPQNGSCGLIADHDSPRFHAVALRENLVGQAACERVDHFAHMREDVRILSHIEGTERNGNACRRRLHVAELLRSEHSGAAREFGIEVKVGCLCAFLNQIVDGELAECLTRLLGFSQIHLHHGTCGLMQSGQSFASFKVVNIHFFHTVVRFTKTKNGNIEHGRTRYVRVRKYNFKVIVLECWSVASSNFRCLQEYLVQPHHLRQCSLEVKTLPAKPCQ